MRKLFMTALLAGTISVPAIAQEQEKSGHRSSEHRAQSADHSEPAPRPQRARRAERDQSSSRALKLGPVRIERRVQREERHSTSVAPAHLDSRPGGSHRGYHRDIKQEHRDVHASNPNRREHRDAHRDLKRDHRTEHRSWERDNRRAGHGDYHRGARQVHDELHASNPSRAEHRAGHRYIERQHDQRHSAWDTSWRSNRSYDWRNYRGRFGSIYNLSPYYDPYGYRYRNFSIGFNLWPSYYGSQFWLHDPWQYRLPPAYGPYRWIRYYNDALLVNIYTGQVVDAIHSFFW